MLHKELSELGEIFQGQGINKREDLNGNPYNVVESDRLEQLYLQPDLKKMLLNVDKKSSKSKKSKLERNDVVISIRGSYPKASVVGSNLSLPTFCGYNLAVFRRFDKSVNSVYIAGLLRSQYLQQVLLASYEQSSSTQLLHLSELKSLKVPVPPLSKQKKIADLFLATEKVEQQTLTYLKQRQELKEAVLQETLGLYEDLL